MNIEKFVIRDRNSGLYFQCWTERDTMFLTDDLENIENYSSLKEARSVVDTINNHVGRFLNDKDEKEICDVKLQAGKIIVTYSFEFELLP